MKPAAREADVLLCEKHPGGPGDVGALAQPTVFINNRAAIRLGDRADCSFASDVVAEGASQVRIGSLPAAAVAHKSLHAAAIGSGSHDVNIGGPIFALPRNIEIGGSAHFRNLVIRDVYLLSTTRTGRETLKRLEESGSLVRIEPSPDDGSFTAGDAGRNSTIYYNPSDKLAAFDENGGRISAPAQITLGHELVHSVHIAEGTDGKTLRDEEGRVRGDGSDYDTETINENRLREDLGQPQRWGKSMTTHEDSAEKGIPVAGDRDLRPGGY